MIETVCEFLVKLFNDNTILATIVVSIIPLFELKVAIPFGMNTDFWTKPLSNWGALGCSILGGFIITVLLALVFKPIYERVKDKKFFKSVVEFFTGSAEKKSSQVSAKTEDKSEIRKLISKMLAVFLFVAIPVPGTGVYTGTVLGVFMGLKFWQSLLVVTVGNFVAGVIIMFICTMFPNFTTVIIAVFVALVLLYLLYRTIVHFVKKKNQKEIVANDELKK